MKNIATKILLGFTAIILVSAGYYLLVLNQGQEGLHETAELEKTESKVARGDYFFQIMRDPATDRIPRNIRARELSYAKNLPTIRDINRQQKAKDPSFQAADYIWDFAGPVDVGGRTRALGIDRRNSNIILAGGVSGGLWKSTDGGTTWTLKTPDFQSLSVTSLAQDPLAPDTWYYGSGEFIGNSAGATGAPYFGTGIYKSTDNGESWNRLSGTSDTDVRFDSEYDFISRVVVSPTSSSVFFASNGFGVYRSTDGQNFTADPVIGSERNQIYADVAVASDGTVAAAISARTFEAGSGTHNPGIFISNSDGASGSWTEITPSTFPSNYGRSVLAFAPSNPDILYVLTHVSTQADRTQEDVRLHKIDLNAGTSEDRSDNIPEFDGDSGDFWTQNGYDLDIAVKPDDENFILIGGTNLFRGRNGFASLPSGGYDGSDESQKDEYWVGGYNKDRTFSLYPSHHPDQHITAFDPGNSNRMISGHDGGLSVTADITAAPVSWSDLDEGYTTSQYYSAAIPGGDDDERLIGGMQDNGSPFFRFNGDQSQSTSNDISFGDGGYSFFTPGNIFVSRQGGQVIRYNVDPTGEPVGSSFRFVHPSTATGPLFIHPYVIDPNDETIMYYPSTDENGTPGDQSDDKSVIFRNTQLELITNQNGSGTSTGWEELSNVDMPLGYNITALAVSNSPANILYYGGSSDDQPPVLKRLNSANSANDGEAEVSPAGTPDGAYIKNIAINPANAEEVLLVMSNYNITGLYHTTDGGSSWTPVEGNLTGSTNPGPSLRSAVIIPAESGTMYVLGTSTGVYSTQTLDGSNTSWGQEGLNKIGFAVTEHLDSRISDGDIAAGTHGLGMFKGSFQGNTDVPIITLNPSEARSGQEITINAQNFQFSTTQSENQVTIGNKTAEITGLTSSAITAIVPRAVIGRDAPTNDVVVSVTSGNEKVSSILTVLPPQDFKISQNFPNPFNPTTQIPFDLPADAEVTISIYDILGRKVKEPLRQQPFNGGTYNTTVDLTNLASGVYIYRIVAESAREGGQVYSASKKMTLIK